MCGAAETSELQAQVYFMEERSMEAIKMFKPSPEVKPRATGKANKFRQPAKRQESSRRKRHYCGSHHVLGRCPAYDSLKISDIKLQEISDANKSDPIVQELKSLLECGWDSNKGVSLSAKKYLQYKGELHFVDDLLLKLDLIVVPESMRREILNRLREGYSGIVKTINMARTYVFWPGISKDIKELTEKYPVCAKFQIGNAPEPEMLHEFPTSHWVKVAIDFFYFNGKNYVEVVDYYSKFIEVQLISSLQATVVIPAIKSIFARHGIPLELISDCGPPFNSRDFDCF
ncbi:Uncharacterized protein K02A2.6 [Araneus ventricosus]|uniref:RNA-directed DNA polymerase n=1 Tax=Araneus ventricosus TaxID=182803 RepID=A0A4Y2PEX2_ARAVE|nr:Uncharacterized protein K02A2.6 [Araneus ventricosus]